MQKNSTHAVMYLESRCKVDIWKSAVGQLSECKNLTKTVWCWSLSHSVVRVCDR